MSKHDKHEKKDKSSKYKRNQYEDELRKLQAELKPKK